MVSYDSNTLNRNHIRSCFMPNEIDVQQIEEDGI